MWGKMRDELVERVLHEKGDYFEREDPAMCQRESLVFFRVIRQYKHK